MSKRAEFGLMVKNKRESILMSVNTVCDGLEIINHESYLMLEAGYALPSIKAHRFIIYKRLKMEMHERETAEELYRAATIGHLSRLRNELERYKEALNLVNDHAESCSIFIYDDKRCTCFYGKILCFKDDEKLKNQTE